jgi:hypothetical protein
VIGDLGAGPVVACVGASGRVPRLIPQAGGTNAEGAGHGAHRDTELVVGCGLGLALLLQVPLVIGAVVIVPPERELLPVRPEEIEDASAALDLALGVIAAGKVPTAGKKKLMYCDELWIGYEWERVVAGVVDELAASALVLGEPEPGAMPRPAGRGLLWDEVACPVIHVGRGHRPSPTPDWPPPWLARAQLRLAE